MPQTILHLVRHGQTQWNVEKRFQGRLDSPLTELGKSQARMAGEILSGVPLDYAYASPLPRTLATAELVLHSRNLAIAHEPRVREINLGPLEGELYEKAVLTWPEAAKDFWERPHLFQADGAETVKEVQERMVEALEEIVGRHPEKHIVIISHGMAIKTALAWYQGYDITGLNGVELPANGSVTTLTFSEGVCKDIAIENPPQGEA